MRRQIVRLGSLAFVALFLTLPVTLHAEIELAEDMTQGDFALWLIDAIEAKSKLGATNPGYGAEEAINFLGGVPDPRSGLSSGLGIYPEDGWQKDEPMTKELLATLLEDPEEGANLSWEELVDKVRERIKSIFDERKLAVFQVLSPTPSLPAG